MPFIIAYCIVPDFIPDKLSVCLLVTVIVLVVLTTVGAVSDGLVLSIFTTVVLSDEAFPALSTALNLIVSFLSTV